MTSLKQQTVSGVKWVFVASIIQRVLSFVTTVILARILSPADFGLFALAFVMIDAFGIFKSLGFDSALVRRKNDLDKACNTAFFLIPTMGMILFVILFIIAPFGAKFLNNHSVANVIRALAVIFVITCFGKVPQTILYRAMRFKYRTIAEISGTFIYTSVAIILAFNKFGVWSLVIAYILRMLVQISIEWYFSGWKPKLEFDKNIAWDMFHFGKYVLGSGIVLFLYGNLDNILVGKVLGVTMLGYYAISMNLSSFLSNYFLDKVGLVMYPAYSKIQDDIEDVKSAMLKTLKYISLIAFPFSFGLFIFAPDIIRIIFGKKWLPATDIVRILAFVGLIKSLGSVIWPIFLARGKSKADFQVTLAQVGIFFLLLIPLSIKFKLIGVAYAVLVSTIISFSIGITRIKMITKIELINMFESIKPALLSSLLMLVFSIMLKLIIPSNFKDNFIFFITATVACLSFFLTTYFQEKNIINDIKTIFNWNLNKV